MPTQRRPGATRRPEHEPAWRRPAGPPHRRADGRHRPGRGAAKGLAHLGVLRVLKENNVPIDYIAGSSIGAIIGARYAPEAFELEEIEQMNRRRPQGPALEHTGDVPVAGFRSGRLLSDPGPTTQFNELPTPFVAVATDLASGRKVALRDGPIWRAVQASVSIPGISRRC